MIENLEADLYLEVVERRTVLDQEKAKGEVGQVQEVVKEIRQGVEPKRKAGPDQKTGKIGRDLYLEIDIQIVDLHLLIADHILEMENQEADPGLSREGRVVDREIIIRIKKGATGNIRHQDRSTKLNNVLEVETGEIVGLTQVLVVILKLDHPDCLNEILVPTLSHQKGTYIDVLLQSISCLF